MGLQISREQRAKMATQLATMDAIEKGCKGPELIDYIKSPEFSMAALRYMEMFNDGTLWES